MTLTTLEKLYNGLVNGTYGTDDIISQLVGDPDVIPAGGYCDNEYIDRTVLAMLNDTCSVDRCVDYISNVNPRLHWHYHSNINGTNQINDTYLALSLMNDLNYLIKAAKRAEFNCAMLPTSSVIQALD